MEKLDGVVLEEVWPQMNIPDRYEAVKAVAAYQNSWASVSFEQFGSLYFTEDFKGGNTPALVYTDDQGQRVEDPRFSWLVLQQTAKCSMLADATSTLIVARHVANLPPSPVSLRGPGLYQPTREKKITALECYLKLLKYLLPADRSLGSSHLWHGDLHVGTLIVDPANRTRIVGLIDWQSAELCPLYFQARQPCFIDHKGPTLNDLERPKPPDCDNLDDEEKKAAQSFVSQPVALRNVQVDHSPYGPESVRLPRVPTFQRPGHSCSSFWLITYFLTESQPTWPKFASWRKNGKPFQKPKALSFRSRSLQQSVKRSKKIGRVPR
ncbi:hypothetical protein E4U59_003019 [Claviceps monticola]|nr:hypothetical protein E4U59_003019 [Claviceps monticola]